MSNHQRLHCLLNCWFRRRSEKTSKPRDTGLYVGTSPVTSEFLAHKTLRWKMFPFDDVIMIAVHVKFVVLVEYTASHLELGYIPEQSLWDMELLSTWIKISIEITEL